MFTVLPKLGVAANSAIMNVEPVFALGLGWAVLDQQVAWVQVGGALLVVSVVVVWGCVSQARFGCIDHPLVDACTTQ